MGRHRGRRSRVLTLERPDTKRAGSATASAEIRVRQVPPCPGMPEVLDGVLDSLFPGGLSCPTGVEVFPVLEVLKLHCRCPTLGMAAGGGAAGS